MEYGDIMFLLSYFFIVEWLMIVIVKVRNFKWVDLV